MQNNDYQDKFAISQSAIKDFDKLTIQEFRDIHITKTKKKGDEPKFIFGSLVDTIRFTPTLLDERFFMPSKEIKMPSDKIVAIVKEVFRRATELIEVRRNLNERGNLPEPEYIPRIDDIHEFGDIVYEEAKNAKFGGDTWSRNRIIDHVNHESVGYYRLLSEAKGREIISGVDNADAVEVSSILENSKRVRDYFIANKNEMLLHQVEIFIDYIDEKDNRIPLKGAVDIIRFIHARKKIRIADLKTTFESENFKSIAKRFNYALQLSFYRFLIKEWLKTYEDGKYADYEIEGFYNVVIDRRYKIPYLYKYSYSCIDIAEHGSVEHDVVGWRQTLKNIAWHIKTGVWDMPREMYDNGEIILNIYD